MQRDPHPTAGPDGRDKLTALARRAANPLRWPAADKGAVVVAVPLTFFLLFWIAIRWIWSRPATAGLFRPGYLESMGRFCAGASALWIAVLAVWLLTRRRRPGSSLVPALVVVLYVPTNLWTAYQLGYDTSPWAVLSMVAGFAVAAILFEQRVALFAFVYGTLSYLLVALLEAAGLLEHTPGFSPENYYALHSSPVWHYTVGTITFLGSLCAIFLVFLFVVQWRDNEAELARAYAELNEAKDRLVRAESLASIGHLVTGAAHELRNPLASSGSLFQTLKEDILASSATEAEKQDALRTIDLALRGQGRAALIAERLYSLSDILALAASRCPLDTVLASVAQKYPAVRVTAGAAERAVPVSENALLVILGNLIENALAAGGDGPPEARFELSDGALSVTVADLGCGIPDAIRPQVFRPFVTGQKAGEGHGVGLGLYIVHELVNLMQGTIELDSAPGRGTRVGIRLPAG